jgi:hypothetical protein
MESRERLTPSEQLSAAEKTFPLTGNGSRTTILQPDLLEKTVPASLPFLQSEKHLRSGPAF